MQQKGGAMEAENLSLYECSQIRDTARLRGAQGGKSAGKNLLTAIGNPASLTFFQGNVPERRGQNVIQRAGEREAAGQAFDILSMRYPENDDISEDADKRRNLVSYYSNYYFEGIKIWLTTIGENELSKRIGASLDFPAFHLPEAGLTLYEAMKGCELLSFYALVSALGKLDRSHLITPGLEEKLHNYAVGFSIYRVLGTESRFEEYFTPAEPAHRRSPSAVGLGEAPPSGDSMAAAYIITRYGLRPQRSGSILDYYYYTPDVPSHNADTRIVVNTRTQMDSLRLIEALVDLCRDGTNINCFKTFLCRKPMDVRLEASRRDNQIKIDKIVIYFQNQGQGHLTERLIQVLRTAPGVTYYPHITPFYQDNPFHLDPENPLSLGAGMTEEVYGTSHTIEVASYLAGVYGSLEDPFTRDQYIDAAMSQVPRGLSSNQPVTVEAPAPLPSLYGHGTPAPAAHGLHPRIERIPAARGAAALRRLRARPGPRTNLRPALSPLNKKTH